MSNTVERFAAEHQAWQLATLRIYFPQKPAQQFDALFHLPTANLKYSRSIAITSSHYA
jgi:hypothetical protein